jgi:hypothetical protein
VALWLAHFHLSELVSVPCKIILSPNWFNWLVCLTHLNFWYTGYFTLSQYWWWVFYMYVVQKVRFPIFYLNKITTHRATNNIKIHSHISFTSPHKSPSLFRHLLQWYINLSSPSYKKWGRSARNHFLSSFWTSSLEWNHWPRRCFSSLGKDGSPTEPDQNCMVDAEQVLSPRSSKDSQLWQYSNVEHCHAKDLLWSTILVCFSK